MGEPAEVDTPLVRVHRECVPGEVFGSLQCNCRGRLDESLLEVGASGVGVVVYLRGSLGRGANLNGAPTGAVGDHDFSVAAAILRNLGVRRFRALVSAPVSGEAARDLGLEIVECVQLSQPAVESP